MLLPVTMIPILFTLCNRDIHLPNHPQLDFPTNYYYISDPTFFINFISLTIILYMNTKLKSIFQNICLLICTISLSVLAVNSFTIIDDILAIRDMVWDIESAVKILQLTA